MRRRTELLSAVPRRLLAPDRVPGEFWDHNSNWSTAKMVRSEDHADLAGRCLWNRFSTRHTHVPAFPVPTLRILIFGPASTCLSERPRPV